MSNEVITVQLVPSVQKNLKKLMGITGLSKTDAINRAVTLYLFVEEQKKNGKRIMITNKDGSSPQEMKLF